MEPAETYEHAGMTVEIHYDELPADPRAEFDHIGVMFCDHPRYSLGDADAPDPRDQEVECDKCEGEGDLSRPAVWADHTEDATVERTCDKCEGTGMIELSLTDYLKREHGARVILPLFLLDHSGLRMRTGGRLDTGEDDFRSTNRFIGDGAGWDTSSVGVIFDTAESRKVWGFTNESDEQIEAALRSEVEVYDAYLSGAVYGFIVKFPDGEDYESCWGFYELDYCKTEANEAAESGSRELESRREACLIRGDN